ncbi:hypothetical protein THA_853 [Thermosipho africanus TCF52B]|uniref:Uncharacterized protein n=1 Tax=Thermosipho africanus (strain TCF52B) TaxID=484019 RepID=B7IGU9_THEAB|nr:hypothetical protein THA_853 [Thermosipho africanus TCF52B]
MLSIIEKISSSKIPTISLVLSFIPKIIFPPEPLANATTVFKKDSIFLAESLSLNSKFYLHLF